MDNTSVIVKCVKLVSCKAALVLIAITRTQPSIRAREMAVSHGAVGRLQTCAQATTADVMVVSDLSRHDAI